MADTLTTGEHGAALREVARADSAKTVAEVVDRLRAIGAVLPPRDGIRAFTTLYLAVTEAVDEAVTRRAFEDVRFVRWLDVVFANLYFDALRGAVLRDRPVPRAWVPVFEAHGRQDVLPLQFALAGMNAHINRDLPLALVRTGEARGVGLRSPSPQQRDFRRIDALLARTEERVKTELLTGALVDLDVALGQVDDLLAMWKVERAREAAWVNGELLWSLRRLPRLRGDFLDAQDRIVGLAGRGLLRPLARVPRYAGNAGGSKTP